MEIGKARAVGKTAKKVPDFTDLETWRLARELRRLVYRLTARFPQEENFGLTTQMRRTANSVTASITEGFGRYSNLENIQFCRQSRGSIYETRDHLTTALDANYISKGEFENADALAVSVIRIVNGYIRSTRNSEKASDGD